MGDDGDRPEIWLLRHGATEWSVTGRHTGRTDLPLLDEGRDQARAAAPLLDGHAFSRVRVSPLARARETAVLAGVGGAAEPTDLLLEMDYGAFEGITTPDIRQSHPGWTIWTGAVPGGETLDDVATRADRVIAEAGAERGDTLLVAHGHILRVLIARWCGLPPDGGRVFALDTATVSVLGWEHEYPTVRALNLRAAAPR